MKLKGLLIENVIIHLLLEIIVIHGSNKTRSLLRDYDIENTPNIKNFQNQILEKKMIKLFSRGNSEEAPKFLTDICDNMYV